MITEVSRKREGRTLKEKKGLNKRRQGLNDQKSPADGRKAEK